MLDRETEQRILKAVCKEPRTVLEISKIIGKSWRTTSTYIETLKKETGLIGIKLIKQGNRNSVKIIYLVNQEHFQEDAVQKRLEDAIMHSYKKTDFSPFDIYQYVDSGKRNSFIERQRDNISNINRSLAGQLLEAKEEILVFSGDFSWINLFLGEKSFAEVFSELARKNVQIKVLANVDVGTIDNIERTIQLNSMIGKRRIEVRHSLQPLRGFVVDRRLARFREIKNIKELNRISKTKSYIFYEIYDKAWVEWLTKLFYNMFSTSIGAETRISNLRSIKKISE
jgi:hypothetical protein